MKYLILATLLFLANACSSFEPSQHYVDGCYGANSAEACRQLAFEYGNADNTEYGVVLLDRACKLGSERACDQALFIRAKLQSIQVERQYQAGAVQYLAPILNSPFIQQPQPRRTAPTECRTAPEVGWDGNISMRTRCE